MPYPLEIDLNLLTPMCVPRDKRQENFINGELTEDIDRNGLKYPLEINWRLEEDYFNKFRIFKGNQRIIALRNLGIKSAPCIITIDGFDDTFLIGKILEGIFG